MSQAVPLNGGQYELDQIIRNLNSVANKLEGLNELQNVLSSGLSSASFLGQLEKLFSGLRQCLLSESTNIEIVLKANQVLLDMIPDIQHSDELEIQYAQLIPIFVENLGSPKAVVRKSTHKCIATYVKLSKKLEFVILHLVHSGLENSSTRTRQHSMLVIPALLSLKPSAIDRASNEIIEMMSRITKKLKDPQDIVAKTAKKLILELQKCYPTNFETVLVSSLKSEEDKIICRAVLRQDEDEIQRLLYGGGISSMTSGQQQQQQQHQNQSVVSMNAPSKRYTQQEEIKNNIQYNPTPVQSTNKSISSYPKELSIVGKEILQSTGGQHAAVSQIGRTKDLDKIINEAKEESRYPKAHNGLYFGFIDDITIDQLNENNQWKERTSAIEAIESKLNQNLSNDKKVDFIPYATPFLGFIIQYIPDINFKISLSTVKIIIKLLQMNIINFKKYYSQLVSSLIEKLADSKVVIRQAVLKCCSLIIINHKSTSFSQHCIRYLQHGNWHVREGALSLLAHCIITQESNLTNKKGSIPNNDPDAHAIPLNSQIINEICSVVELEDKQKIQSLIIDVLALAIDKSPDRFKTQSFIQKGLNLPSQNYSEVSDNDFVSQTKEQLLYKQIQERVARGNLPFLNDDGIVEFPSPTPSQPQISQKNSTNQVPINASQYSLPQQDSDYSLSQVETFASSQKQPPSLSFMENKKKLEEEKRFPLKHQQDSFQAQQVALQQIQPPPYQSKHEQFLKNQDKLKQDVPPYQAQSPYLIEKTQIQNQHQQVVLQPTVKEQEKISMWLPSFPAKEQEQMNQVRVSQTGSVLKNINEKNSSGFNATGSSVATFLEDGRTTHTTTTMLSLNQKAFSVGGSVPKSVPQQQNQDQSMNMSAINNQSYMKSPGGFSENEKLNNQESINSNSYGQGIGYKLNQQNQQYNSNGNIGYTPEQHNKNPRNIQSNELRQRTMESEKIQNVDSAFDIGIPNSSALYKNMSQSSGVPGGFGVGQNATSQATDRLQLLKTKYNAYPKISDTELRKNTDYDFGSQSQQNESYNNIQAIAQPKFAQKTHYTVSQKTSGIPIKAQHPSQQFMHSTIQNDDNYDDSGSQIALTPHQNKTKKTIGQTKSSAMANQAQSQMAPTTGVISKVVGRAQSVDGSVVEGGDNYQPVEEPLGNPELSMKQTLEQLQSGDWAKQFEACNTVKRIAMFHKNFLSNTNYMQGQIIKELVKLVDSLRSQLAKNAILALHVMYENLPQRDMDTSIDQVLPVMLKRAADSNAFISETAEKALCSLCTYCSENKIFNSLQSLQNVKSNPLKLKVALCYNILIEKIGSKIRMFGNLEKLVQIVAVFMNEGALEVRNMAKIGLLGLRNALGSQRELEQLLMRFISNEKQFDKIKAILDKGELEQIANTNNGNTRYGTSMRGSSLDSRSAGPNRGIQNQGATTSGSDGFGQFSTSDFSSMQNTFIKGGSNNVTVKGGQGFGGTTSNGFKKPTAQPMAKPVDPILMEEFKQIVNELQTNEWTKRLKAIDTIVDFVKNNQTTIKSAQPSKFIQLIDIFCKLLQDNNAKVLSSAQVAFKILLLNQNLKALIEQNLSMIIQALCQNLSSNNFQVKDQGELLFSLLETSCDSSLLISPIVAQLNLSNNKTKPQLLEKLQGLMERCDKINLIQKQVGPLLQSNNKIQIEAGSNPRLKDALNKLQVVYERVVFQVGSGSQQQQNQDQEQYKNYKSMSQLAKQTLTPLQGSQKSSVLENKKLDKIVNDSKTRRNRGQRDLEKSQPMTPNSQYNAQCETVSQISTPANAQSHQNFPQQKEKLASSMRSRKSFGSASATANAKRKSTQNYIEKNKKELETLQQVKQSSRNIYTQHDEEIQFYMRPHQTQVIEDNGQSKKIKAKVNSGLQRSKSQVGKLNSTKKVQNILDMTPKERLQEDLKWNVTKEAKQEINDVVNSRYAQLEHELFTNMNGKISEVQQTREDDVSPLYNDDQKSQNHYEIQSQNHDNTPKKIFIDDKIKQIQERNGIKTPEPKRQEQHQEIVQQQLLELLDYQVAPDDHIQQVQEPQIITQTKPKVVKGKKKKSKKPTPLQVEEPKSSEIKTPNGIQQPQVQSMTRVKTARNNLRSQAGPPSLKQDTKERPKSIVKQKLQTAPKTPTKDYQKQVQKKQIQTAASKPSLKVEVTEKKPFQSKTNQGSKSTKAITNKSIKIEDTLSPLNIKKNSNIERIQTQEDPREVETFVFDNEPQINQDQKEQTQSFKNYNLSTKEDFLNFDIENIWKEMEEIGRSKQAAHELFDQFQNNYYDKKQSNLFDKLETSPTKRFVQIKNATAKHHVIESKKGIKDSTYMIQYTTCPDKSYVVKPDGGEIKYDNYPQRRTNKLVQKIIDGTVEKIKLKDSPVMSPKKKYMINSPVKITSKHCKRVCDEYSQEEEEIIMQQQQLQEQEQLESLEPFEQFSDEKQIEQCQEQNDNDDGYYHQYQQNVLVEGRK